MTHLNKRAVITGASQGIGLAIATRLAKEGAHVAVCDINGEKAGQEALKLCNEGFKAIAIQADVSNVGDIKKMIQCAVDKFGGLDILINNAGILDSSSIADMQESVWDRVMAVNLKGVFFCCQAAIPHLKNSKAPRIINISSVAGRMGAYESGLSYTASKGGILSMTMGMARQLSPFGITVNAICPGPTETDIIKQWTPEQISGLMQKILLGRLGKVSDVASAAAFLTGDEAGFITGISLDVNGGMYMC